MRSYLSAPLRVDLNLTNACHLKCKYCYASAGVALGNELTLGELDCLFQELEEVGVFRVQLAGGEPILRKDFVDILSLLNKYDFSVSLNTTGFFLTKEICIKISQGNFELVTISLEGDNANLHEKIKGGVSFDRAIAAIKMLKSEGINTAIGITLNSDNIDSIFKTIDLVRAFGVQLIGIQVLCPVGRLAENIDLIPDEKRYVKFVSELIQYQRKYPSPKINLNVTNESPVYWEYYYALEKLHKLELLKSVWNQDVKVLQDDVSCVAGISVCSIGADGEVYPCEMFVSDQNMSAGNIRNLSFKDIWSSSKLFQEFRKLSKKSFVGACFGCKNRWCGGGCRAAAYYSTGKLKGTDMHCYYAKK